MDRLHAAGTASAQMRRSHSIGALRLNQVTSPPARSSTLRACGQARNFRVLDEPLLTPERPSCAAPLAEAGRDLNRA
jgi:hypothetical protein